MALIMERRSPLTTSSSTASSSFFFFFGAEFEAFCCNCLRRAFASSRIMRFDSGCMRITRKNEALSNENNSQVPRARMEAVRLRSSKMASSPKNSPFPRVARRSPTSPMTSTSPLLTKNISFPGSPFFTTSSPSENSRYSRAPRISSKNLPPTRLNILMLAKKDLRCTYSTERSSTPGKYCKISTKLLRRGMLLPVRSSEVTCSNGEMISEFLFFGQYSTESTIPKCFRFGVLKNGARIVIGSFPASLK
mmetsp:Transcript_6159/g.23250  ORF Transcript_6159/g.23250 Transcript_6159/m.23250 type:complete len:249 (+) Transcript_6159:3454-4200(+)